MPFRDALSIFLVGGQCLVAVGALAAMRMQPPAEGNMLLVPVAGQTRSDLAALAVARGLSIVTEGNWNGSLVVRGERDRLGWSLVQDGVLVLSTDIRGCANL